jgi:hypothetical protein
MENMPGTPENLERVVDHELAEILSAAELAGFGANGFVFRVPGGSIPTRFADDLRSLGEHAEVPADIAMKMLKVYEAGTAAHEVAMQQKAWEAMREHADDPAYASIPRVYFAHTAHFSEAEQQQLTTLGLTVGASADVILMDFVPGRDVREILAEQVMQRSEGATPAQIQRTTDPDSDFRYAFLKKRGYTLDLAIADRVEKTVRVLHDAGIFHNDLHEANIMHDGERTYIVDFGSAGIGPRREHEDKGVDDLMVPRRIRAFQPEQPDRPSEDELDWRADAERLKRLARTHQFYQQFRAAFIKDHDAALSNLSVGDERTLSQVTVQLLGALQERLITPDDAATVLTRVRDASRNIPIRKKLDWFIRYVRVSEQ